MNKRHELIYLNNQIYAVDKEADIKSEDWKYHHVTGIRKAQVDGKYTNQQKIVAASDKSLGLPILPAIEEDVQKLASHAAFHDHSIGNKYEQDGYIRGWELGYKAASAKKYSEEQASIIFEAGRNYGFTECGKGYGVDFPEGTPENKKPQPFEIWIKSLSPLQPVAVELEMVSIGFGENDLAPRVDENNICKVVKWIYE